MRSVTWMNRSRLIIVGIGLALIFGGACNCEEDPDPDPDVVDNDVDDVEDDVDEEPVDIPEDMARIQVVHNAADPGAESIDVWFDEDLVVDDFDFRTATPYVDVDADNYEVNIAPAGSDDPDDGIVTFEDVEFDDQQRYLVVANGVLDPGEFDANPDGEDIDLTLYVYEDAREVASDSDADDLLLFHGATDAPGVDLRVNNEVNAVSDLTYGSFTDGYLSLAPGITVFDVLVADSDDRVASYQTPSLDGGDAWVGLASGFLNPDDQNENAPFEIVVYPTPVDGDRLEAIVLDEAARVQLAHDSIDPDAESVDLFADDMRLEEDLEFRDATPFLTLASGQETELAVAAPGADAEEALESSTIEFDPGETYLGIVSGVAEPGDFPDNPDGADTALDFYTYSDAREDGTDSEAADVLGFHSILDGPEVVVDAEVDGDEIRVIDDFGYGEFADYTTVATDGDTQLAIAPAADPDSPVAEFAIDTEAFDGEALTMIASGLLAADDFDAPSVALVVVDADGETVTVEPE